jgi:glycosyltransferase involved in cell wall biosynthesis
MRRYRLAYVVSHPIQYQAPMLRRIAQEPDIDLTVFFCSDFSVRGFKDKGFGVTVQWDVPLLEGYQSEFLPYFGSKKKPASQQPMNHGIFSRLRKGKFDAVWVHGYTSSSSLQTMIAARLLGIPVMLRAEPWLADRPRSTMVRALKSVFFTVLRGLVSAALPIGTLNDAYWRHYFGDKVPRILLPYCVDNQFFQKRALEAAPHRAALQAELNLDPTRPVILFASKLQTRKHCGDLLEAYLKVLPVMQPQPYLILIGDGEQRGAIEARLRESGEADKKNIHFLGFRNQTELPRYFDLCNVFVLPSRYEPWGLVVNEAMNSARAVIVTNEVGSYPDLVRDGENGYVTPASDVDAMAAAIRRVLADPETAVEMGRKSLQRIESWSFEQDINGLRTALETVCGGHSK